MLYKSLESLDKNLKSMSKVHSILFGIDTITGIDTLCSKITAQYRIDSMDAQSFFFPNRVLLDEIVFYGSSLEQLHTFKCYHENPQNI